MRSPALLSNISKRTYLAAHKTASLSSSSFSSTAGVPPRPFRVLGVQQVAVGCASKSAARALWVDCLGLPVVGGFRSERENVDEDILRAGPAGSPWAVEVDIMEPVDPARAPRVADTPLNPVGLWVDNLPAALEWLAARGVRLAPGGIRRGAAGHDSAVLHPKGNDAAPIGGGGVLIELVQAPPAVVDAFEAAEKAERKA